LDVNRGYNYHLITSNAFGVINSFEGSFSSISWAGYAFECTFAPVGPGSYLRTATNQNGFFSDKSITVEMWFLPGTGGVLASETDFTSPHDRSILELQYQVETIGNDTIVFPSIVRGAFNGFSPITIGRIQSNAWNHVALRYDAATHVMDGFLNGVKGDSTNGVRISPADAGFAGQFAFARRAAINLGVQNSFIGVLEEIRVWNTPRTDEDLSKARFNVLAGDEPGLVLNWRGDFSANNAVPDFGPLKNNGSSVDVGLITSTAPLTFGVRENGADAIETQFAVKGGSLYRLESSSDFSTWVPIATNTAPTSGYIRFPQLTTSAEAKYFRIVAQ
jgi:hypothetical protein